MAVAFSFVGQKGGTGKTTTAIAVASELVARGRKVLLVDADPQGSSSTWASVGAEAGQPIPTTIRMGEHMHRAGQLDALAKPYEFVVIDTPPRHGEAMRSALVVADVAVLPCGPSAVDAWALASSLEVLSQARMARPELKACVLVTRKVARTAIGESAREVLSSSGLPVLGTELGFRVAYQEGLAAGLGPAQYAPGSSAAAEVTVLVDELLRFHSTGKVSYEEKNSASNAA